VAAVVVDGELVLAGDGFDGEVVRGADGQVLLRADAGALREEVASGTELYIAALDGGDALYAGASAGAVAAGALQGLRLQYDVAPGQQRDARIRVAAGDDAGEVLEVVAGVDQDVLSADAAAPRVRQLNA
jgi:hypothetical protein